MQVRDKVVVITGAARASGKNLLSILERQGAHVAVADLNDCSAALEVLNAAGARDWRKARRARCRLCF